MTGDLVMENFKIILHFVFYLDINHGIIKGIFIDKGYWDGVNDSKRRINGQNYF